MNKKYFAGLLAFVLLASCSSAAPDEVSMNTEVENQDTQTLQDLDNTNMDIEESDTPLVTEVPVGEVTPEMSDMPEDSVVVTLNETYTSPGWEEWVSFTLTLDGDIISDIQVVWDTDNQISQLRQGKFIEAVANVVEWKTISEAQETWVIGGSSLTTAAFHNALKSL